MFLKKNIKIINILFIILIMSGGLCYNTVAHNLVTKTLASSSFFLLGLINLVFGFKNEWPKRDFASIMTAGLAITVLADVVLEIDFLIGALIFAVGHIFYMTAYCRLLPLKLKDFSVSLILFISAAALMLFAPIFDFGGPVMQTVCIVYAAIISVMFGKAFANFKRNPETITKIVFIGSFLFTFSDIMLLFEYFADAPRIVNMLCVNTYYPAQALLAFSLSKTNN